MSAARAAYTAFIFLAAPFAALYLLWRSRRQPEYRLHWSERFGFKDYAVDGGRRLLWLHAVSLGETRAAEPLIDALAKRFPHYAFLLTHMTPTGRAAGEEIAARWPGRVVQSYLPYDMPYAIRRFLRAFRPVLGMCVETEAWPNLLAIAEEQRVPMVLVNARLSESSYNESRRYASLMRETAARFVMTLAQTEADAARIRKVGANVVEVTGNVKFDMAPDPMLVSHGAAWRRVLGTRPVWLFATTRDGEEALLLAALPTALTATVIIVPRHPQRFDQVAEMIDARGLRLWRRSKSDVESATEAKILLGDSMGEMAMYYAAADAAFIGGSLVDLGGHNLIEACAVGTPVVVGPHTFNFEQATEDAIAAGAAVRVADAQQAIAAMASISGDPHKRQRMSEAALHFAAAHRGATARTVDRLVPLIEAASASPVEPRDSARVGLPDR